MANSIQPVLPGGVVHTRPSVAPQTKNPEAPTPHDAVVLSGAPSAVLTEPTPAVETAATAAPPPPHRSEAPAVLQETTPNLLPESVQKASQILQNAPAYRQQVGAEYVGQVVHQVPKEFHPWLKALQPIVARQAGDNPKSGSDPYHLLGLQLKSLSLAAMLAETQAQMAQARGENPDRKELLSQELGYQFDTQAYCQVASPELLEQIASRNAPPEAQFSSQWFCEQLRSALGRPPEVEGSPLQKALRSNPDLVSMANQSLPGTAANWTRVVSTTSDYLEHMNCVMVAEQQAANTILEFTQPT